MIAVRAFAGLVALGAVVIGPPPTVAQSLTEARVAIRTGEYDAGIRDLIRLAEREGSVAARRALVRALAEVGRFADAERYATVDGVTPAELANVRGEIAYAVGRASDAERWFREAITRQAPDRLTASLNLAVLQYERGERDAAMAGFDRFIDVYNERSDLSAEDLIAVATAARYLGVRTHELFRDALRVFDHAASRDSFSFEAGVRTGELFLAKFNNTDASAAFTDVLAVNARHPRALLGMARSMYFDGRPEAIELVRESLDANPNLVSARAFLGRLYIDLEEYGKAVEEVEGALEVNPVSLEALSVLAAVHFLRADTAAFETVRDRVLTLNPRHAELYTTLAELSARNRLYREAAGFAAEAVALDPESWRGHALRGVNQLRIGDIAGGRASLDTAFEGDPYDLWTLNTLNLLDTFDNYTTIRTEHFELFLAQDEAEVLGLYMAELADEAYERLAERYGFRPPSPIRLEVYPRHADFSVRTVGLAGLGALGVSFGTVLAMDSPSAQGIGDFHWGSTLWHEVAHTFHLTMSNHKVPRWFTEGLAVHEERKAYPGWGDDVSVGFLLAYTEGRLHPVSGLNEGFVRPAYPEQVVFSYYLASLVCEMIERDWGAQALEQILVGYGAGLSTPAVLERVLGLDQRELDRRFDDFVKERFTGAIVALEGAREARERRGGELGDLQRWADRNPNDFTAQLAYGQALVREARFRDALTPLERAAELFPAYAGPDSPLWFLGVVHRELGSPTSAIASLQRLTEINATHYPAWIALAEMHEAVGDTAAAANALDRSLYVYPFELEVHQRLAEHSARTGDLATAVRERRAVLAMNPVDVAEARYQVAYAYFQAGDYASARREVLRTLEGAPNFAKAQDLLLDIRNRRDASSRKEMRIR